jgi:sporulation protein YlmC with PRC-barrel domain
MRCVGRCLIERRGEMARSCQTVLSGIRQALQGLASLRGMNVFTADDKELGKVVEVVNGPDGEMRSIQVQIAPSVGLGDRVVTVDADTVEQVADRIRLRLAGDAVRSLPVSGR